MMSHRTYLHVHNLLLVKMCCAASFVNRFVLMCAFYNIKYAVVGINANKARACSRLSQINDCALQLLLENRPTWIYRNHYMI